VQVEALEPSDRVLVLGESSMPQTCIKSDEVALMALFKKVVFLPAPDHSGRLVRLASCGVNSPLGVLFSSQSLYNFHPACLGSQLKSCWSRRFGEHTSATKDSRCLPNSHGRFSAVSQRGSCRVTLCRYTRHSWPVIWSH
jgi:hypothetical protein